MNSIQVEVVLKIHYFSNSPFPEDEKMKEIIIDSFRRNYIIDTSNCDFDYTERFQILNELGNFTIDEDYFYTSIVIETDEDYFNQAICYIKWYTSNLVKFYQKRMMVPNFGFIRIDKVMYDSHYHIDLKEPDCL